MNYTDFLDTNDLKILAQSMNSRVKQVGKSGRLTIAGLRHRIYDSGGKCEWCTVSLIGNPFEIDHIIPLYRGGGNVPDNIAVACPTCNRSKSAKHPARFAQETYARTSIMTNLIERVLQHYNVEPISQLSLFDSPDETVQIILDDDNFSDEPPPYIWGK